MPYSACSVVDGGHPDVDRGHPDVDGGHPDVDGGHADVDRGHALPRDQYLPAVIG